ncbi:MAG: fumarylacetoacetase [Hydrogenophaga sp.]|uniref:fumarylacetoacetase n=1 Tax=Hydrogenophaga sp. TaxID=1904254 RepID=UPI003D12404B
MGGLLDHTHDPAATSWVTRANGHDSFPIQNLPLARIALDGAEHVVTAVGDHALDLTALAQAPGVSGELALALQPVAGGSLQNLMAAGPQASRVLRRVLFDLLGSHAAQAQRDLASAHLLSSDGLQLLLPCRPPTFTDFYSSIHHAIRIGSLVRPDAPLLPNYRHLPVGYHGRATSVFPSGQAFRRPRGQIVQGPERQVVYAPSARLDYEAELGFLVGAPSHAGDTVPLAQAREHLFGVALLNDWSARDIQFWEYAPLGPFLGKSFATTLGAWVVTREALEPFWTAPPWGDDAGHTLLPHLDGTEERTRGALNATVEVYIRSARMRELGVSRHRLSVSNCATSFWTVGQMIAHQTSNGASIDAGDLIGSGTLSGPTDESRACLMELTEGGQRPFALPGGETRSFLEDGDEVTLVGWCETPGRARIGLGEATARVLP